MKIQWACSPTATRYADAVRRRRYLVRNEEVRVRFPAGPYFTMNWIRTVALAAGLAFSPATSYSNDGKKNVEKDQVDQKLINLAQTALRCGKKEIRMLPNERGIDHLVDVYTIGNSLPQFKYGDTYLFQFYDGSATKPNGKVDSGDRFQIADHSTSIWGPIPYFGEDYDNIGSNLPALIEYVRDHLPKECYQKEFNCC